MEPEASRQITRVCSGTLEVELWINLLPIIQFHAGQFDNPAEWTIGATGSTDRALESNAAITGLEGNALNLPQAEICSYAIVAHIGPQIGRRNWSLRHAKWSECRALPPCKTFAMHSVVDHPARAHFALEGPQCVVKLSCSLQPTLQTSFGDGHFCCRGVILFC